MKLPPLAVSIALSLPMWLLPVVACADLSGAHGAAAPGKVRVAFVISEDFNVMDFAGPWEVFQDVMLPVAAGADMNMPFELYTVATSRRAVRSAGGATVVPEFTLADAPKPDIIVIGAQADNSTGLLAWLRAQHAANVTIASICTGARKLALAGLLDGKPATTHHDFIAEFGQRYPAVQWQPLRRYVRASETLFTAGGLTSGIDLALHLVAMRYGDSVAAATADYMEYTGDGWRAEWQAGLAPAVDPVGSGPTAR
jgi:transcriptional regulator GlxA family with amidase domain